MRYALIIIAFCGVFLYAIGSHIHGHQRSEAERGAKELRPYSAKVELIQAYKCKGNCYRTFVSYKLGDQVKISIFVGGVTAVGQAVTVWAKPDYRYAYTSPSFYVASKAPAWSPVTFLLIPFLALLGGMANVKFNSWRTE